MGALGGIVASRIAREFQIGGPSFTVSSEETSGLRALEIAVRALRAGELDSAVVGAVDIAARPLAGAETGEGAACLVLKRAEDAKRDGDRIYAVIRGIGAATGGGINAPAASAQAYADALRRAYDEARVDPSTIGLLETNGSGVPAEDAAEARRGFFRRDQDPGALRSGRLRQMGHAGGASGLAGVVKAALAL